MATALFIVPFVCRISKSKQQEVPMPSDEREGHKPNGAHTGNAKREMGCDTCRNPSNLKDMSNRY
ncbi:hypothetical protein Tsumi_05850 [Porphyromonas miyakawae]|uniref:Uncharacterized protein n=1 Tax=Porphyromonas miyakawae TaxID=3137470 RepID=A0ABQ0E194_9PORP